MDKLGIDKIGKDVELQTGVALEAEQVIAEDQVSELLKGTGTTRKKRILEIDTLENLEPEKEGMALNEGYEYTVDGAIPQLADALAKMAIEMDKDLSLGEAAGGMFITLIAQFYEKLKSE